MTKDDDKMVETAMRTAFIRQHGIELPEWINSRHPQNKVIEEPDPEFDRYMRQAEIYQELSDEADRAMAFAIILGALLFGVLMIITAMYRDGMIMI